MDTLARTSREMAGFPLVFTGYELAECRDSKKGFRLGRLRQLQLEKSLQIILREYHGIATSWPYEVYHHAEVLRELSLVKMRRVHPVRYLMTIRYRCQKKIWEHVFRYERNTKGGISVSGQLFTHSRQLVVAG